MVGIAILSQYLRHSHDPQLIELQSRTFRLGCDVFRLQSHRGRFQGRHMHCSTKRSLSQISLFFTDKKCVKNLP